MAYKNIEDRKAASKRHYYANKDRYLARNKAYRTKIRKLVMDLKDNKQCADCLTRFPYYVMDFDHIDAENKLNDIHYLSSTGRIGALKEELKKCELVCANCHRIRTHTRYLQTQGQ